MKNEQQIPMMSVMANPRTGPVPMTATREIERSITLLMTLEKQLGTLIGRDLYSI